MTAMHGHSCCPRPSPPWEVAPASCRRRLFWRDPSGASAAVAVSVRWHSRSLVFRWRTSTADAVAATVACSVVVVANKKGQQREERLKAGMETGVPGG